MLDSNVDLEVIEGNKTNIDFPSTSVSSEEGDSKMEDMDAMDGNIISDAILMEMSIQALLEKDKNKIGEFVPPVMPRGLPPAPARPLVPPFGVSQDFRYQQHSQLESDRGARQRTVVRGQLAYNATPLHHQPMVNVPPESARKEFLALARQVRTNTRNLVTLG